MPAQSCCRKGADGCRLGRFHSFSKGCDKQGRDVRVKAQVESPNLQKRGTNKSLSWLPYFSSEVAVLQGSVSLFIPHQQKARPSNLSVTPFIKRKTRWEKNPQENRPQRELPPPRLKQSPRMQIPSLFCSWVPPPPFFSSALLLCLHNQSGQSLI